MEPDQLVYFTNGSFVGGFHFLVHVLLSPYAHGVEYRYQGGSQFRQRVLYPRRVLPIVLPQDQSIFLQDLQVRAEALECDPVYELLHLVETDGTELREAV